MSVAWQYNMTLYFMAHNESCTIAVEVCTFKDFNSSHIVETVIELLKTEIKYIGWEEEIKIVSVCNSFDFLPYKPNDAFLPGGEL